MAHWLFTKVLAAAILLHVLGALKHHVMDRDATLRRMARGVSAPAVAAPHRARLAPLVLALGIYGAGAAVAVTLTAPPTPQTSTALQAPLVNSGNWQVQTGSLGFRVTQMGAPVEGSFAGWTAEITFDEGIANGPAGRAEVVVDLTSVSLGSVSEQVKGPEFFDVTTYPTARFTADLIAGPKGFEAIGSLHLRGVEQPVTLPFTLRITGDSAEMTGRLTLDRRDFGIGAGYGDEETVGYAVEIMVTLTAARP
jgi:polyisoprenoid-binding protein YceI